MLRKVLSEVFRHAIPKGLIGANYARDVIPKRRPRELGYANRPWTPGECATVLERAPADIRVALALMMNTGIDPSDAIRLRKDQIEGGVISSQRAKTGVRTAIPVGETLHKALEAAPAHEAETVLANSRGTSWAYRSLSSAWQILRRSLEAEGLVAPGMTLKGLRHTVATTLREAGLNARGIADLLGQKSLSMPLYYSRSANLAEKNRKTVRMLDKATEGREKIANPTGNPVKPPVRGKQN